MATGCLSIRQRRQGHLCPATAGIEISGVLEAPRRTSPRRTSGVAGRGISRRRPPGAGSVRQGMDLRAEAVEGGGAVLPSGDPRSTSGHFQATVVGMWDAVQDVSEGSCFGIQIHESHCNGQASRKQTVFGP